MLHYFALGDSYTICEGAQPHQAWPNLLATNLTNLGVETKLIANPSVTGYTTADLIRNELPIYDKYKIDFVTLLIGVNDWVQKISTDKFQFNLNYILDYIQLNISDNKNILLVNIPDFGVTPKGHLYGYGRNISQGLEEFNEIIKKVAQERGLKVTDIYTVSKRMVTELDLVAEDQVHASAKMYAIWGELILADAYRLLSKQL